MKQDCDKTTPEELADFLIERFNSNIESFKKFYPDIGKEFECYTPNKSIDFFCSESGTPNMSFSEEGVPFYEKHAPIQFLEFSSNSLLKKINTESISADVTDPKSFCKYQVEVMLNGKYNITNVTDEPDLYGQIHFKYLGSMVRFYNEKAKRRVCKISECRFVPFFVLVGVGLGYQLEEMYEKIDIANLIIIEPNKDVFFTSLHTFDWKKFLDKVDAENKHVYFLLEDDIDRVGLGVYRAFIQRGLFNLGANFIYYNYEDELNLKIHKELVSRYKQVPSAFGFFDDAVFGIAHSCYSLCNKKNFVLKTDMFEEYQKLPVFIIGSGPSLDHDLPFIRKYQDKAIIVACGTAIDVLYHSGVKADFYANTERVPEISQALSVIPDKSYFDDIILLCSSVTHPSVVDLFSHTAIFGKKDENFCGYLAANLNLKEIDTVSLMNPLVGNMGVSGAIQLGFKKIFLFGLDNGKKLGNKSIHSIHTTLYKKRGYSDETDFYSTRQRIDANFGGECETNDLFIQSVYSMKISIAQLLEKTDAECFNCSDGALIDGASPIHSEELVDRFNLLKNIDKIKFKKYISSTKTKSFDVSYDQIRNIIYPQIYKRICDNILEIIKDRPSNLREWMFKIQSIGDFLNNIANDLSVFYARTADSSISSMLTILTSSLFATDDLEERQKNANHLLDIFEDYLLESPQIFEKLPDYIMGEHRKFYPNGKVGKDMPHCKAPDFPNEHIIIAKEYDDPVKEFVKRYE